MGVSAGEETWSCPGCPLVTPEAGTRGLSFIDQATLEFVHHGGLGCSASETALLFADMIDVYSSAMLYISSVGFRYDQ